MTCLKEDKTSPCSIWKPTSPNLQTVLSLLVTSPMSQQLEKGLMCFCRRQKWQGNHRPIQSELLAHDACTLQTRHSSRQSAAGIFTTSRLQQTWGRSVQSPHRGNHSPWQSKRAMSQTKSWTLPCESWKSKVHTAFWVLDFRLIRLSKTVHSLGFFLFLLNSAQQHSSFHALRDKGAS